MMLDSCFMKSSSFISVCVILIGLLSCSEKNSNSDSDPLDEMLGTWEFTGTAIVEKWARTVEGDYHIDVISHAGWEPERVQYIGIHRDENGFTYEGHILRNHNSTRPIRFRAVESSDSHILFENVAQEFPKNIHYMLIHKDKIRVRMSGSQNGKYREQDFIYYRQGNQ